MPDDLSPRQVAARLGASQRSVQRWIAAGHLPGRRIGGRWRVALDALDAFVVENATGSTVSSSRRSFAGDQRGTVASAGAIGRIYVANRGEIARRIERTCLRLGIQAIVPETDGIGAIDLLDPDAVVAQALTAGADALHPGYGFLSESAAFASAVASAGLRWIGPPAEAIAAMGDKSAARRLAASLGVPVVPGYDGADQTDPAFSRAARRIGLPLLVKPMAGGGGKGIRVVRDLATLVDALASARREAQATFGDNRLILERFVEGPRHIEIQVLFDAWGDGVHLGERDCSIQRRHQKILEETPSPGVDDAQRRELGGAALALARAVGYVGAGTCEFLLDDRGHFYFLEMNTRLQVEHPVTELVCGRDLVADQIRIASGEPLGLDQADADAARKQGGHAIEVRLYAEDAEAGFLPATGRVEWLAWPPGASAFGPVNAAGIRIDAGIDVGSEVTGRFDPMIGKVIAQGQDRAGALARLAEALDQTVILGLTTNLRFLRWLVREQAILDGQARVDTLGRIWPPDDWIERAQPPDDAWSAAARLLARSSASHGATDAGSIGWRLNAPRRLRLVSEDGLERWVDMPGQTERPPRGDTEIPAVVLGADDAAHVDVAGRSHPFRLAPPPDVDRAVRAAETHQAGGSSEVVSPMPGAVLTVHVEPGARVEAGDPIVTLEAMKMEHVVAASGAGTVRELAVRPGDQVVRGQLLAVVE